MAQRANETAHRGRFAWFLSSVARFTGMCSLKVPCERSKFDADGVLHPEPPRAGLHRLCWLPFLVKILAPYPDVRVVVHSSWRLDMPQDYIAQLMSPLGAHYAGVTKGVGREASIRAWLKECGEKVSSYRVLDDMPREFREGWTELIICPSREGVTHPAVQAKLKDWLRN